MFRCVTDLKGLIIDLDSFSDQVSIETWSDFVEAYKCVFITSRDDLRDLISERYGEDCVLHLVGFIKLFAPSRSTHDSCIDKMKLKTTEVVYVSRNIDFLKNAMGFLCGSIWVTEEVVYEEASTSPDLICRNVDVLKDILEKGIMGYKGETQIYPCDENRGVVIPVVFSVDDEEYLLFALGRYFGYAHYMNQLHPYSSTIYLNKQPNRKSYRIFDKEFADLYSLTVSRIKAKYSVDGVCAVPSRPGKEHRFDKIVKAISDSCGLDDLSAKLICEKDYEIQKTLSQDEREQNVKDVFVFQGDLSGRSIVLIDDVASTGSTLKACIRALKEKNVEQIYIVVLGINQLQGIYWSSNEPQICCPKCNDKMHLLINCSTKQYFYSCYSCGQTMNFDIAFMKLVENVNNEKID